MYGGAYPPPEVQYVPVPMYGDYDPYRHPYERYNRRRRVCACCPDFSIFWCCSVINRSIGMLWVTAYMLLNAVFCFKRWTWWAQGTESSRIPALLHAAMALLYFQCLEHDEQPNFLLHLVATVLLVATLWAWWGSAY